MHTAYNKISARERDTAPRYYYKRTRSYTFFERIRNFIRKLLAFLFTQVNESQFQKKKKKLYIHFFSFSQ